MNALLSNSETDLAATPLYAGGLRLRVFSQFSSVEGMWRSLERNGICTVYQSFDWCETWWNRIGSQRGIAPCIVVGETGYGQIRFLMPLQLRSSFGVRIVETMAAPQSAYTCAVYEKEFFETAAGEWFKHHMADLQAALPLHDVLKLADVLQTQDSIANPLLASGGFVAANESHIMGLRPDFQALLEAKRSSETRRTTRKRDAKLEASGTVTFGLPLTPEDYDSTLATMFSDQEKRLSEFGVHNVFDQDERRFIFDLAMLTTSEGSFLRPYTLRIDGETQAVMLGAYFKNTYWALVSSLAEGKSRKLSPGDYALRRMIKALCEDGTQKLDFSAGDTAYKLHWSDERIKLFFVLRGNTLKGICAALFMLLREKSKRFVKRTPLINSVAFAARRLLAGRRATTS